VHGLDKPGGFTTVSKIVVFLSNTLINFFGSPYVAICTRGKILWQRDPRDVFWAMEDTQTIRQNQMGQRGKEFWQNRGFI
jgi:hypothetical protein